MAWHISQGLAQSLAWSWRSLVPSGSMVGPVEPQFASVGKELPHTAATLGRCACLPPRLGLPTLCPVSTPPPPASHTFMGLPRMPWRVLWARRPRPLGEACFRALAQHLLQAPGSCRLLCIGTSWPHHYSLHPDPTRNTGKNDSARPLAVDGSGKLVSWQGLRCFWVALLAGKYPEALIAWGAPILPDLSPLLPLPHPTKGHTQPQHRQERRVLAPTHCTP